MVIKTIGNSSSPFQLAKGNQEFAVIEHDELGWVKEGTRPDLFIDQLTCMGLSQVIFPLQDVTLFSPACDIEYQNSA